MNNTIILRHGFGEIADKGDTIWGIDSDAQEVKRWIASDEAVARDELNRHKCQYHEESTFHGFKVLQADEWALEFCECDENGDFVQGSDYELAEEC